ncbi:receptor-interacting serine/threonine-protein kinase 3-like [Hemicordylus capensis]|uniref:receptor-interacting serine/threonine-protein kinase 3-like n=1 Tax=Hemicordylus capensis TaxID=884348 RepID=UPI0023048D40|nr:receptor-interacting serine/threonine-protein kinase 3-like [Hemicordylus capensis]XP_053119472.1 receptor-interacting serine/threonine-protein kinase 3-like [Hemicordylus capensis]
MASPNQFCDKITHDHLEDFQFLCKGAFGTVYRARHQGWRIDVAVKILTRDTSCTQEELLNEARAMDAARFTYILRLFGLFVGNVEADAKVARLGGAASSLGLVMEFMENGSLTYLRNRHPSIPWALRLRILYQVALGMNFLHSLNPPLLHLDLKPSNVLLDGELHAKVADFGLSKFKRGTTRRSSLSKGEGTGCAGTLEYMPPEAFTDLNYKPTPGTDVYSYGILMWSLLTGEDPYPYIPPGNLTSLIRMHIPQGQRPNTEELEEKIKDVCKLEDLIGLMKRCWHNEKAKRPPFQDCSQELEEAYSCYKPQIIAAVREVQDVLMQMDSSSAKETRPPLDPLPKGSNPVRMRPKSWQPQDSLGFSSGLEERFKTMHVEESLPRQNEAMPTFLKPDQERRSFLQRSQSARNHAVEPHNEIPHHPGVSLRSRPNLTGGKPRPLSDTFTIPMFPPGFSDYPPSFNASHPGEAGLTAWQQSHLPHFFYGTPQRHGGIHISGHDVKGIQIGNCNSMHLELSSGSKP